MKRRNFIKTIIAGSMTAGSMNVVKAGDEKNRPNIIICLTDDQGNSINRTK